MKKVLVINGPNLNMLGKRDPDKYGKLTLGQINNKLVKSAKSLGITLEYFQSNHEGEIIDFLQKKAGKSDGVLINPGALTHYGYSLRDALEDTRLPIVEVHLSDIDKREDFRKIDVLDGVFINKIHGLKEKSYLIGLEALIKHLNSL